MKYFLQISVFILIISSSACYGQIVYVTSTGSGFKDGSSWQNALGGNDSLANGYRKLADTLSKATPSTAFWIAEGEYYASHDNNRDKSFPLPENISIYGSFAGTETSLEQRDLSLHQTILSGNIGEPDIDSDNAYHVLISIGPYWYQHTILNGLTITGGYAHDPELLGYVSQKLGGGIYSSHKLTIEYCRFHNNKAINGGGAIYQKDYGSGLNWMINELNVNHCQFDSNSLLGNSQGGAIHIYKVFSNSPSTIQNTTFFNNSGFYGSAIYARKTCSIDNCLIANNSATEGAVFLAACTAAISHSTLVNNSGRALSIQLSSLVLKNSIVWGGGPVIVSSGSFTAYHSCWEDGDTLNGSINTDPLFVNPTAGNGTAYPGNLANWRLRWCSPCFDTGDSTLIYPGTTMDLDGYPRVRYSQTDMGVYELDTTGVMPNVVNLALNPIFVNDSAQYSGDGNSWSQALSGNAESCRYPGQTLLYEVLKNAAPGTQFWLKKGVYKSSFTGSRNQFYEVNKSIKVYGGFEGTEAEISERGNGVTLFSGDYGLQGDSTDNARHVLKINSANATFSDTALLDRIQIRYGHADGTGEEANGAGIWIGTGTKLKLNECKFERNIANSVGSGIYTKMGTLLLIDNSSVSNNTGCAIYNQGKLIAYESQFNHNRNASEGIAIYNTDSLWMYHCSLDSNESVVTTEKTGALSNAKYARLYNCSLQYNKVARSGGGACNKTSSYLEIDSCQINYNQCTSSGYGSGGGLYNEGQLILNHTTLNYNQSKRDGGGLCNSSSGTACLDDCVVVFNIAAGGNSATFGGGGICNSGVLLVNRSKICNNSTDQNGGGIYNPTELRNSLVANNTIGGNLRFGGGLRLDTGCQGIFNSTIVNNSGEAIAAAYNYGMNVYLLPDTFQIHNCILHGNETALLGHFTASHSMIQGTVIGDGTNIPDDPIFTNPSPGIGSLFNGIDADWQLSTCSPCIDKGGAEFITQSDSLDLKGNQRPVSIAPDMGAYEFQSNPTQSISFGSGIVFITESNTQLGLGTSWNDTLSGNAPSCKYPGFSLLYEALRDIPDSCDIWLKKGTYFPSCDLNRNKSLEVKKGCRIFGGFSGSETHENERDLILNRATISGDIGLTNDSTDNSYHLLITTQSNNSADDSTFISGINFSYATANGVSSDGEGAGILNEVGHHLLVDQCSFMNNYAAKGASVYNKGLVEINNSFFSHNHSTGSPCIYNLDSAFVFNCNFTNNRGFGVLTNQIGSFLYADKTTIDSGYVDVQDYLQYKPSGIMNSGIFVFKRSSITNQIGTTFEGGAIKNNGNMTIDSCIFTNNSTQVTQSCVNNIGSISIFNSSFCNNFSRSGTINNTGTANIINCVIDSNNGGLMGPGFAYFGSPGGISNSGSLSIIQSVLSNNFAAGGGGALLNTGDVEVQNCLFEGNSSGLVTPSGGGMFQIYAVSSGFNGGAIQNNGTCLIEDCSFYRNNADHGAALSNLSGFIKINNSKILENFALMEGAAFFNQGAVHMNNTLIANNQSNAHLGFGSVLSNGLGSKLNINNSTLANSCSANNNFINTGVDLFGSGNSLVINYNYPIPDSVIVSNSVVSGNSSIIFNNTNQSYLDVMYSCIDSSVAGIGNLDADPQFVDATTFIGQSNDSTFNIFNNNWELSACSPCIDQGNDSLVVDTTDLAGNARIFNRVDMGAYELQYFNGLHSPRASSVGRTHAVVSWQNRIKPCRVAVFVKDTCCGIPVPLSNINFIPDSIYSYGSNLNGWYCVFNGIGDSVSVFGLNSGTNYRVTIFNYLLNQFYDLPESINFTTEQMHFDDIAKAIGTPPFIPVPVSSAGILDFDFQCNDPQVAVFIGDTLHITGLGSAIITAYHYGNSQYLPDSATALLNIFPMELHNISIPEGWSGLSSWAVPHNPAIEEALLPIQNQLTILQTMDAFYFPSQNTNTIGTWENQLAFKIKVTDACVLNITGIQEQNKNLVLEAGWNLMPVICNLPVDAVQLFSGLFNDLKIVKDVAGSGVYWPEYGINSIGSLLPGKAYFVKMNNAGTVTFPQNDFSGLKASFPEKEPEQPSPWGWVYKTPSSHIFAIPAVITIPFSDKSFIGAFTTEGVCAGTCSIKKGQSTVLVVNPDDPLTPEKECFTEGEPLIFRIWDAVAGKEYPSQVEFEMNQPDHSGVFAANGISAIRKMEMLTNIHDQTLNSLWIFPNPSSDELNISGIRPGTKIYASMISSDGKTIITSTLNADGQIDIIELSAGIYFLKLEDGNSVRYEKVVVE